MAANKKLETKICAACGLPFSNRKRWASRGVWDEVKYCSDRCRKQKHPATGGGGGQGGATA